MDARWAWLFILMLLLEACSTRQMMLRMASPLFEGQYLALSEESDPILAESAIPASLKMLEGLIKSDPENQVLHIRLAEGFCSYAFSFVEDEDPERASRLYLRGRDYAVKALVLSGSPENLLALKPNDFKAALADMNADALPGVFWMGQCWANWLRFNLANLEAFVAVPKVEAAMQKTLEWDESYHFAGPHLFFGGFYGSRPALLGGDSEKARKHFDRALQLTENKFLVIPMMYAKTVAIQTQDKPLFEKLLNQVLDAPSDLLPEQRLANEIAKLKARQLLENADDYF